MLHHLENTNWQAAIDPEKGGSIYTGRIRVNDLWVDVLREATPASFLMLPWANRIRDGVLRYKGQAWQLQTPPDGGAARHGNVRNRPWQIVEKSETKLHLKIRSQDFEDFNFPFTISAEAVYELQDADFIWKVTLTNEDTQPFPAGFGFHPYWRHSADNMPLLQVPCTATFVLTDMMADSPPIPIPERLDFREPRAVTENMHLDDLLTARIPGEPVRLIYEQWDREIQIIADDIFAHVVVYTAPDGSLAVEQQTNANDGFNLLEKGIEGSGVFTLDPGESISGTVRVRVV